MATPHHSLTKPKTTLSIFINAGGGMSIVLAALLVICTLISVQNYKNAARLEAEGVETVATVTARDIKRHRNTETGRTTTSYRLTFQFVAVEQTYTHIDSVSAVVFEHYQIGQTVPFWYWPQDPRVAERVQGETFESAQQTQQIALFAGLAGVCALWWFGRKAVNAVLARRFGLRTTGHVGQLVEHRRKGRRTGKGHMVFHTPNGVRGVSFTNYMSYLNGIGVGATVRVYQYKSTAFWEGDVGPRILPRSSVPEV